MIYTNISLKSTLATFEFGNLNYIYVGESGRGRRSINILCDEETELKRGNNEHYSISYTKTGKPKLVLAETLETYAIVDTYGGYTRRGNGFVVFPECEAALFEGNGADGKAGRIGSWGVYLFKVEEGSVYKINYSGRDGETTYLFQLNGIVYELNGDNLTAMMDTRNIPEFIKAYYENKIKGGQQWILKTF